MGSSGDRKTLAALYDAHARGVYGYVYSLLANAPETEDVVQEVFLRALEQSRKWLGLRNPVGYLYRAARNEALSRLRKQVVRSQSVPYLTDGFPILRGADGNLVADEEAERVSQALSALPVEQREVVVLKIYEDMTFREIARIVGISNNTAASRYRYGLAKLKETLNDEEVPHGRD